MTDIKKYVEGKTQEELIEIQRNSVVGGDVYKAVTFEIQRIQQDTNNIQIAKLIGEIQKLKDVASENSDSSKRFATWSLTIAVAAIIVSLIIGSVQIYLAKIQVDPILEQQYRAERNSYEFCKEPGNWDIADGGSTPGSACKETYINLKEKFGTYPPAEQDLNN
jgi:hypothetical protein